MVGTAAQRVAVEFRNVKASTAASAISSFPFRLCISPCRFYCKLQFCVHCDLSSARLSSSRDQTILDCISDWILTEKTSVVGDLNFDLVYFCSHRDDLEGVSSLFHVFIPESGWYCLLDLPTRGGCHQNSVFGDFSWTFSHPWAADLQ